MLLERGLRAIFSKRHDNGLALVQARAALHRKSANVRWNQRDFLKWFLWGFAVGGVLAAAILVEVGIGRFSEFTARLPFAAIFENRHSGWPFNNEYDGSPSPHLAFRDSVGAVNEALPLGIAVNDSSGGETLVVSDLVEGTKLSAGTALSSTRWSVPVRELDRAFIAAPEDFRGSMQLSAKLYSADNLVLETRTIRFEWTNLPSRDRRVRN